MVEALITVLVILVIFGVLVWAIATYAPLPQPFLNAVILIVILIGILIALQRVGIINI